MKGLYQKIVLRAVLAVLLVLPISLLYDLALAQLSASQATLQGKCTAVLIPLAFIFFLFMLRVHLTPVNLFFQKLKRGEGIGTADRVVAERRVLILPYILGTWSGALFFIVSLINNWILLAFADLGFDTFIYLVAGSVTTAVMMGLGSSYLVRPPLRQALVKIMETAPALSLRPPFFVPISFKITSAFFLIVALILVFSGLLSSVIVTRMIEHERRSAQSRDTLLVAESLRLSKTNVETALAKLGDDDGAIEYFIEKGGQDGLSEWPRQPSASCFTELISAPAGQTVVDSGTGWTYAWARAPDGVSRIISASPPVSASAVMNELKGYYGVAGLIVLFIGVGVGFLIAYDISSTLRELRDSMVEIAEGAGEMRLTPGSEDETGILARSFNRMGGVLLSQLKEEIQKSREILSDVREALKGLGTMSKELLAFARLQTDAGAEQSSAAHQTALSSQEVAQVSHRISQTTHGIVQAAEGSLHVTSMGREKVDGAERSLIEIGEKVANIQRSVTRLGEYSRAIAGISGIIAEINDQINLLALNAALEAAGAEEHGFRFGVVAEEIQRLADGTNEAMAQIRDILKGMHELVTESMGETQKGVEAVRLGRGDMKETARIFEEISKAISEAASMIREIDEVTVQQSAASDQMARAMADVQRSAMQSSEASGELMESVQVIDDIISQLSRYALADDEAEEEGEETKEEPDVNEIEK